MDIANAFNEEMLQLHRGQGMDLYWRENCECPIVSDYIKMIENSKLINVETGGLLRLAIHLLIQCSTTHLDVHAYDELVNLIGVHFQIRDDYMNLNSAVVYKCLSSIQKTRDLQKI